jgi:choline monooxygenase
VATSLKQLIESYDPDLLLSEASTPACSWYSDPRVLELEQRTVFSLSWQMVGRADQFREPGRYITCDVAGEPMLLVTGHDGVVRGFYNVCRHHAAALMTEPQGRASSLSLSRVDL